MYLIIGANGYLGSYVTKAVTELTDEDITATSRDISMMKDSDRVHWVSCDIQSDDSVDSLAEKIVFTGQIDAFFNYSLGELDFRSLRFEHKILEGVNDFQGNAVVNYTEAQVPYTRIIEHKHFEFGKQPDTVITYEFSRKWEKGAAPYYPINNQRNNLLYSQYAELAQNEKNVIFGGRLAEYKYYDMHQIVENVLKMEL